jgi:hypothetical protein
MFSEADKERFWSKVDKKDDINACWEWTAGLRKKGYGGFQALGTSWATHRVAIIIHLNKEITAGMSILHSCDNRKCCNPHHLREGTNAENVRDRVKRCRSNIPIGEKNPRCKLTEEQVRTIRKRYEEEDTITLAQLGRDYNVAPQHINCIIKGKTWKHLIN